MNQKRDGKTVPGKGAEVVATPSEGAALLHTAKPQRQPQTLIIGVFLAAIIWVVFGQTIHHGFVGYDDQDYVYANPVVKAGLTLKGCVWAFTHVHSNNWHPLTTLTHMMDCQIYGLQAGGHHLTNVLLHAITAILLFLVLRQMTGLLWRSAFVAAVFAIHPLRVESVAWIAERKDVLSGVFFMSTIGAYVHYARNAWSFRRYALAALLFALGLMCKPTLVTLPFVLLLLDYWPLGRFAKGTDGGARLPGPSGRLAEDCEPYLGLMMEKLPFFALSAISCVATVVAEKKTMGFHLSFAEKAGNALLSCVIYLWQMVYPANLAVFYPHPGSNLGISQVALAALFLAAVSAGVLFWRRKQPWLPVGWLWYLGMLVPVIGIVQVGAQARADRYTYLPQIGIYLLITWTVADLCAGLRLRRIILGGLSAMVIAALMFSARIQTSYWHDNLRLWSHTLASTQNNCIAQENYGLALFREGKVDEAGAHFLKAVEIQPDLAEAHYSLGLVMLQTGHLDEAIDHLRRALEQQPRYAEAHGNLGDAYSQTGQTSEAIVQYQAVLAIEPGNAQGHFSLGRALAEEGRMREAVSQYRETLRLKPDAIPALNNLAWLLATTPEAAIRNGPQAVELAQEASRLSGNGDPGVLDTLAGAYAEAGRVSEAAQTAERALELASSQTNQVFVGALRKRLELYRAGLPYHKTP